MMKDKFTLRIVLTLAVLTTANVVANVVVDAIPLPARPVIDGTINEELWADGDWQGGFRNIRNLAPTERDTRFKTGYYDNHLFFAVRCAKPGIDREPPSKTEPGGAVWGDESVEIFLAPLADGPVFQIIVNAWGTPFFQQVRGPKWEPELEIGTTRDADGWTLEMAVPFKDFGVDRPVASKREPEILFERTLDSDGELREFNYRQVDPETGTPLAWRFNVGRNSDGPTSFSPFRGRFMQPEKFAALSFGGSSGWHLDLHPRSEQLSRTDMFRFEIQATYRHGSGEPRRAMLRATFAESADGTPQWTAALPGHADGPVTISLPIPGFGEQTVRLVFSETGRDGKTRVVRTDNFVREFRQLPMEVVFRFPYARDVIYSSQPFDKLAAQIRTDPGHPDIIGRTLVMELRDTEGQAVAVSEFLIESPQQDVALSIPELAPGMYRLAAWSKPEGHTFFETGRTLRAVPPAEHEWILETDGRLLYNRTPFFARVYVSDTLDGGGTDITAGDLRMLAAQYGINTHVALATRRLEGRKLTAFLDRHRDTGVYAVCFPFAGEGDGLTEPLSDAEEKKLRDRVRDIRGHEALLGYVLANAPSDRLAVRNRVRQIAAIVSAEDPYRPLISLHDSVPGFRALANTADIRLLTPCLLKSDGIGRRPLAVANAFFRAASAAGGSAAGAFWAGVELPDVMSAAEMHEVLRYGMKNGAGGVAVPGRLLPDGRPGISVPLGEYR